MKSAIFLITAVAITLSEAALMTKAGKGGKLFPHDSKSGKDMMSKSGKGTKCEDGSNDTCPSDPNPCNGKKIDIPNIPCYDDGVKAADVTG